MSELGQTETLGGVREWSVRPLTTDMRGWRQLVRFVPKPENAPAVHCSLKDRNTLYRPLRALPI
jgi:hypothetical protein